MKCDISKWQETNLHSWMWLALTPMDQLSYLLTSVDQLSRPWILVNQLSRPWTRSHSVDICGLNSHIWGPALTSAVVCTPALIFPVARCTEHWGRGMVPGVWRMSRLGRMVGPVWGPWLPSFPSGLLMPQGQLASLGLWELDSDSWLCLLVTDVFFFREQIADLNVLHLHFCRACHLPWESH